MSTLKKQIEGLKGRIPDAAVKRLDALSKKPDAGVRPEKATIDRNSRVWKEVAQAGKLPLVGIPHSSKLMSHYMDSKRAEPDLLEITDVPEQWRTKLVEKLGTKPKTVLNSRLAYTVGVPDFQNSLGYADYYVDNPRPGVARYVIVDRYEFPDKATRTSLPIKKGQILDHSTPKPGLFKGGLLGARLNLAVDQKSFTRRTSKITEELGYLKASKDRIDPVTNRPQQEKLSLPQRYLEDYGVDFLTVVIFEHPIRKEKGTHPRPEK
ncbi:hypothetical protein [Brevifollis gellanilyticus]|uniref:Uncharacterized protein n=1 Tax=Brevifollis gellanilyticus TaxID=748831 RepID=A0A512MBM7_9BACT|nr:hypothetical protein [Brevifollis gellanilyticus]GEP44145.1 hypothetical protein BGE01nite_34360 [Brevifollis gellanilyticus]